MICGTQLCSFPDHLSWCSKNVPCVCYMVPPVIIECGFLLACPCVGLTLTLANTEVQFPTQCISCCAGADHTMQNSSQQFGTRGLPVDMLPVKLIWILFCCLNLATGCLGSGSLWKNSGAGQYQTLSVNGPGQPLCTY